MNAILGNPPFLLSCWATNQGGIYCEFIHPSPARPLILVPFDMAASRAVEMLGALKKLRTGERSYFREDFPAGGGLEASLEFDHGVFEFALTFPKLDNAGIIVRFESTVSDGDLVNLCAQMEAALAGCC